MPFSGDILDPKLHVYAYKPQGEWKEVQLGMPVDVPIRFCDILEKILLVIAHTNSVLMSDDLD